MQRTKVIHLVEDMQVGGLEKVIANIVGGLDPESYQLEIWCVAHGGSVAEELRQQGITVNVLGITNYHNPLDFLKMIKLLRGQGPDIVHTHGYFAGTIGRLAAFVARVPVLIHHVHSTYYGFKTKHLLCERLLSRISTCVVCCSRAIADFVINHENIASSKTQVIYNGISPPLRPATEAQRVLRHSLGLAENDRVVATVASLTPHKGHRFLLEAARHILKVEPRAKFLVVGDGPLSDTLRQQAVALGISKEIIFCGIRRDVDALLALADIFILPSSEREGLGIAILEAMSHYLPCIGSKIGGIIEVIEDGVTGRLVPPGDSHALAQAAIALLQNPEQSAAMGRAGELRFQQLFTLKAMLSQIDTLYQRCLSGKT